MFYTYILLSQKDYKFYIGYTRDLKRRFQEHQSGKTTSTRNRRPFILLFYEAYLSIEDAQRREKYFKTSKGKSTLRIMLQKSLTQYKLVDR